ncbi:hypothetical protein EB796_000981 [Bugula neritina]|uniref:Uncharacterized protein n=1 Tax=Bugula neritina TaxID=10212 RepID=A0A7J7KRB0_BUGNE|nr:hypothetical protein EB796_000981 [Bugula neritina]
MEVMMSFPAGKMLDMEATLAGGRAEFLFSVKHWFKLSSMISPITTLPLVSNTFPYRKVSVGTSLKC